MPNFKNLEVAQAARSLTLRIYRETTTFPTHEQFGLTSQIRRAAVSIGANIAEGCGRGGDKELARFLTLSLGSSNELEYLLMLASDLGYLRDEELFQVTTSVSRMLNSFRSTVRRSLKKIKTVRRRVE